METSVFVLVITSSVLGIFAFTLLIITAMISIAQEKKENTANPVIPEIPKPVSTEKTRIAQKSHNSLGIKKYWDNMTPEQRKAHIIKAQTARKNNKLAREQGMIEKKKDISKKRQAAASLYWSKLNPEQRRIHIDKLRRGRELAKLLNGSNPSIHGGNSGKPTDGNMGL